jgi:hypothetical protein
LERKFERDDKRVVDEGENRAFGQNMRNLSRALSDMGFAYCLQGIDTLSILLPNLHDLAETAFPNDSE